MHPDLYARLTDRQVEELYGHPRDKDGNLKPPPAPKGRKPATYAEECMALEKLCLAFNVPKADRDAKLARIKAKYGVE